MALRVLRAGILSTVQDLGRYGSQRFGVPVGGVMDQYSHRVANLVVGNDEREATLEITLAGPRLEFTSEALIGLCGGDFESTIGGRPVPMARPVQVRAGSVLDIGSCRLGCRMYLAILGGFDVPLVMGSKSTYLGGEFGGYEGRALRRGDVLPTGEATAASYPELDSVAEEGRAFRYPRWSVKANSAFLAHNHHRIRFVPGRHWERFGEDVRHQFCNTEFRIGLDSDRMGYRLEGLALAPDPPIEIQSEAVTFGSIQIPPDGRPIVLMANRQTVGGYPRMGEVASVDLPLLAQLPPRDTVRFEPITLESSQKLYLQRERGLALTRESLRQRMRTCEHSST
jgi:antagonist of KipI